MTDTNRWSVAALVLWMGVIFYFSSMPGTVSGSLVPYENLLERKTAHVLEYLVLTLLLFRAYKPSFLRKRFYTRLISVGALAFLYACSDEIHQLFVPGREGKLTDIGIDFIGIIIGLMVGRVIFFQKGNQTMFE